MDSFNRPKLKPQFLSFLRSRLSQRIVLSVFGSILAIEGIILVPSVYRREQELLDGLAEQSAAGLAVLMAELGADETRSPQELTDTASQLMALPNVVGGALYDEAGNQLETFGEPPQKDYKTLIERQSSEEDPTRTNFDRQQRRYDVIWMTPLFGQYWVVVCHDTTDVRNEVFSFIGRIAWLVLIISAVVTLSTMIVLRSQIIEPILALSDDLRLADPTTPIATEQAPQSFSSARHRKRNDELGAVVSAFLQMFERISRSIAQREKAEALLRESENRFRTLVQKAAESIFVLDESASIVDVNEFALQYLGYSREALIGQKLFEINPAMNADSFRELWEKLKTGKPTTVESVHSRQDGSEYPVEVRSNFIQMEDGPRALAMVRDISDRKEAEKAQARLAEIGELAAMIVHEVRNPFTTVYMALSTFKTMELPPRGQMRLELALEESERLKRLLNEILAYSKEQRIAGDEIDFKALSRELARSLQESPAAENRKIQLNECVEALTVRGDRDKLKQVLINLVTNACEAIDQAESVTWTLTTTPQQQIEIKVHNGGDPIPPDVLPKLTKPFVSTKANGNGLGLAITKRIIEAHSGSLKIESTPENGTTVTVLLPLAIA